MSSTTPRPPRSLPERNRAVLSREVDGEFVIVNEETNEAHRLEGDVAAVWRATEHGTGVDLPSETVDSIVADLTALDLLVEPTGWTRRDMLKRSGVVLAATGLTTIALPAAAAHASSNVPTETTLQLSSPTRGPGATLTASGTVKRGTGVNVPFGSVSIRIDGVEVATTSVTNGAYSVAFSAPSTAGSYSITAVFTATNTFTTSTSAAQTLTVVGVAPTLTAASSSNGGGGTARRMNQGDTIVLTFSEALDPASVPATVTVTLSAVNNTDSTAALTIPGIITPTTVPRSYVANGGAKTAESVASTALSAGNTVLTLTLGALTAGKADVATGAAGSITLTASPQLTDVDGSPASGSRTVTSLF